MIARVTASSPLPSGRQAQKGELRLEARPADSAARVLRPGHYTQSTYAKKPPTIAPITASAKSALLMGELAGAIGARRCS